MPFEPWRFMTSDQIQSMYFENEALRADLKRYAQGRQRAERSLAIAIAVAVLNAVFLVVNLLVVFR